MNADSSHRRVGALKRRTTAQQQEQRAADPLSDGLPARDLEGRSSTIASPSTGIAKARSAGRPTADHPVVAATRAVAERTRAQRLPWIETSRQRGVVRLNVSRQSVDRALRIAQALFTKAEAEGGSVKSDGGYETGACVGFHGEHYQIRLIEDRDKVPHVPTKTELAQHAKYSWHSIPEHDSVPSGRLRLQLPETYRGRRHRWADGARGTLEEKLPDILRELKERAEADLKIRREREDAETQRQRRYEIAVEQARAMVVQNHRASVLMQQLDAWTAAPRIRAFCREVREHFATLQGPDADDLTAWLVWAEQYADGIDPRIVRPVQPPDPRITADMLTPYLPSARYLAQG